jgi:hypothetical protein
MVARAGRITAIDLPDEAREIFGFNEFVKTENCGRGELATASGYACHGRI